MDDVIQPVVFTIEEVAEILQVSAQTLRRMLKEGTAPPAFRVGRQLRFEHTELQKWIAKRGKGKE